MVAGSWCPKEINVFGKGVVVEKRDVIHVVDGPVSLGVICVEQSSWCAWVGEGPRAFCDRLKFMQKVCRSCGPMVANCAP